MPNIIDTGQRIGPTFREEMVTAGLEDVVVGWNAEGVFSFDDAVSEGDVAAVLAVVAAHDPVPTAYAIASIEAVGGDPATESQAFIPGAVGAVSPIFGAKLLGATLVLPSTGLPITVGDFLAKETLPFQLLSLLLDETTLSQQRWFLATNISWSCRHDPLWGQDGTWPFHFTSDDFDAVSALATTAEYNVAGLFFSPGAFAHMFVPPMSQMAGLLDPGVLVGVPAASTRYLGTSGSDLTLGSSEAGEHVPAFHGMAVYSLRIVTSTAQPATGSLTVTFRVNGVDSLTVVVDANAPAGVYTPPEVIVGGVYPRVAVVAGDLLSFKLVNAASAASADVRGVGILYVPTEPLV